MQNKDEFSGLLCSLYIAGMTVMLPLYTNGTYWQLGDTKYTIFRNLTMLCLGIWIFLKAGMGLQRKLAHSGEKTAAGAFSIPDAFMVSYGIIVLLSALSSRYGAVAWTGYIEWYMGAFSQLLFVGIYFFVSRSFRQEKWPVYLWEGAFLAVVVIGFGQRLGFNPLGLMSGFAVTDWEYSHMISTLGNINWFCGYCSVAVAMPVAGYLEAGSRVRTLLLYPVSVAGLVLMYIQGSDSGIVLAGICVSAAMFMGWKERKVFGKALLLAAGVAFGLPCYGRTALYLGEKAVCSLPVDGISVEKIAWNGWWLAGAVCLVLYGIFVLFEKAAQRGSERVRRYASLCAGGMVAAVSLAMAAGLIALILSYMIRQPAGVYWGNGRGVLWNLSWRGFLKNGWQQKFIGVGPDCFAEYIYTAFSPEEMAAQEGRWAGAIFANAHNEWLNHLINLGIVGVVCYGGIFAAGILRYRNDKPGCIALLLYGANSLVSFQQVLNTPLLFLILGICESRIRNKNSGGIKGMKWVRFRIKTITDAEDILVGTLYEIGLEGAQIEDKVPLTALEKEQMFVDIPPAEQEDDGIAYLSFFVEKKEDGSLELQGEVTDVESVLESVRRELEDLRQFTDIGEGTVTVDETEDIDWINNWKQYFHQFYIDDILVIPSWEETEEPERGKMVLHIDPGTAFGTGMHETTQLCIRQLRKYMTPGAELLDVGTGSGILAILSLMFGAGHALGTDLDICALEAVKQNCLANGIAPERFEMLIGNIITDREIQEKAGSGCCDIVVANILADVLVPLTPVAADRLKSGGIYITSGIIDDKEETVVEAVKAAGLEVLEVTYQGEWVSVTARKA